MKSDEWAAFFSLLGQIVNMDLPTWKDKVELLRNKAAEWNADGDLEEFVGWFQE